MTETTGWTLLAARRGPKRERRGRELLACVAYRVRVCQWILGRGSEQDQSAAARWAFPNSP
jgi:hypothetical protein